MRVESTGGQRIQIRDRFGIDRDGNPAPGEAFAIAEDRWRKIDIALPSAARLILPA